MARKTKAGGVPNSVEMFDVPEEFLALIDRRTLSFLDALPRGGYDVRILLRSAYTQELVDAMQLAGDRPNTFDAIVMGGERT